MFRFIWTIMILVLPWSSYAQLDSLKTKLKFNADFRFRIEGDWNSRRSDGTYRDDRTRLRYRLRAGATFADKWYEAGLRIRTGDQRKQQDPQLTLGEGFKEFGTLPIGFEKVYFLGHWDQFEFWLGKNTYPFEKSNELFWSDNVYPEGVSFAKSFKISKNLINELELRAGHFIMSASGESFDQDNYFQGIQTYIDMLNKRLSLFPSFYYFKNVPNIPDGSETFVFDYSILHLGTRFQILNKPLLCFELDYYYNLQDYGDVDEIPEAFKDEGTGFVVALKYGAFEQKGDWRFQATYAYLEQYAAVDIMAQNDWARWDYSGFDSPDGRLTNYNGIELVAAYLLDKRTSLTLKYYLVEQLVPYGIATETGDRIRLDLDFKF